MGEQKERMLRGDLYIASDPELVEDHRRCRLLLEAFNSTSVTQLDERRSLLGQMLGAIGEDTEIRPPFQCDYGYLICVGHRSFINYGAIILDCARVTIGDEVQFGPGVQILTATHPLDADTRRDGWECAESITIADGVWLGGGVIVCPGVTIGKNAVIGAGSVVTKDIPAGVLAVGNPCRVIRQLDDQQNQGG
jgi:maltose O-acetyltransferase